MSDGEIGTCPVCFNEHHIRNGLMVHHGYLRPGDGRIDGDCFGVGYPPYEHSPKGCEAFKDELEREKEGLRAYAERLKSGEVDTITLGRWTHRRGENTFENALKFEIEQSGRKIIHRTNLQALMQKRIEEWSPQHTKKLAEVVAEIKARQAVTKAEREAKRQARNAKLKALESKRSEREQKRQDLIRKYRVLFEGIHAGSDPRELKNLQAVRPWCEMFRAKSKANYLEFSPKDLGCDEALMALGLAKSGPRGSVYADRYGLLV